MTLIWKADFFLNMEESLEILNEMLKYLKFFHKKTKYSEFNSFYFILKMLYWSKNNIV